jgi:hypothetical protein
MYTCPVVELETAVPLSENRDFSSKVPDTAPAAAMFPTVVIPVTLTPFLITVIHAYNAYDHMLIHVNECRWTS